MMGGRYEISKAAQQFRQYPEIQPASFVTSPAEVV
jgi:hypothetical protein